MALERLRDGLKGRRELTIATKGRWTGRDISLPVWFVTDGGTLRLLPTRGSKNDWYRNLLEDSTLSLGKERVQVKAHIVTDKKTIDRTLRLFREKYGEGGVGRCYSNFDVAVEVPLA